MHAGAATWSDHTCDAAGPCPAPSPCRPRWPELWPHHEGLPDEHTGQAELFGVGRSGQDLRQAGKRRAQSERQLAYMGPASGDAPPPWLPKLFCSLSPQLTSSSSPGSPW